MAHDHGAGGHSHDHTAGANAKMLGWALALTSIFLVAEVVGGFWFNSLALLSDAAHMLTDVAALVIALMAIKLGRRAADDKRTFGYRRFEILAAAFNAVLLFFIAIYVFVEAIKRFSDPEPVQSWGMLIVASLGLVVNLVSMRLLTAGKDASFNVKGAYLEVWADMIGSVGVILGAITIKFTGWTWVDPIVAVGIGLWVLPRTWVLLRDTTNVLLEGVPGGLVLAEVRSAIAEVDGVEGIHDLHVWSMSNDDVSCTVHVTLIQGSDPDAVRQAVTKMIDERFSIEHTTVQTEGAGEACEVETTFMPDDSQTSDRKPRAWSGADDDELRDRLAKRQPIAEIAKAMSRTTDGVRGRAQVLNLPLTPRMRPWRPFPKRAGPE